MAEVLGLFPAFHSANPGGVQASGQLAWDALHARYGAQAASLQLDLSAAAPAQSTPIARSRSAAIVAAWRARGAADTVLCWHADLLPLAWLARARRRTVLFLHGIEVWRTPGLWQRLALRSVDVVLANSAFTLARARQHGFVPRAAKTAVVHLGLGEPTTAAAPAVPPAALIIARLERNERYKGHDELLRAWPRVLQRVPTAQLWIAGEGPLRAELEHATRAAGLSESVRFHGRITEERKQDLLRSARALVMPSRAEGFGLVYVEAMRLARPCLVSNSDAGSEVVNPPECGLAVDPAQQNQLVDAVVRLLTQSAEWDTWSNNARLRYETHFTARAYCDRLLRALAE